MIPLFPINLVNLRNLDKWAYDGTKWKQTGTITTESLIEINEWKIELNKRHAGIEQSRNPAIPYIKF